MTGGPSAGPASAQPTLRSPASICLSGANEVFVPDFIAGRVVLAGCASALASMPRWAAATAAAPRKRRRSWLMSSMLHSSSAERKAKSLHARTKKLDFKLVIGNWSGLPDQLVQTLLGHRAGALFVNINSARHAWRLSVDQHAKFHGRSWRRWAHD